MTGNECLRCNSTVRPDKKPCSVTTVNDGNIVYVVLVSVNYNYQWLMSLFRTADCK